MIHLAILIQTLFFIFQEEYQYIYLFIGLSLVGMALLPNMNPIYLLLILLLFVDVVYAYKGKYLIRERFGWKKKFKSVKKVANRSTKTAKKGINKTGTFIKTQSKIVNKKINKQFKDGDSDSGTTKEVVLEPVEPNSTISSEEQALMDHNFPSPPN